LCEKWFYFGGYLRRYGVSKRITRVIGMEDVMGIQLLKGVATSYVFTFLSFLVFALILSFTNIPDATMPGMILLISMISILLGAATCTRRAHTQGWLWGGIVGLIYALVIYVLSSVLVTGFAVPMATLYLLLGYMATGAVGGIVGINMKKG